MKEQGLNTREIHLADERKSNFQSDIAINQVIDKSANQAIY